MCFGIFKMVLSLISILFIPCFGYEYWMNFYGACHHTLNFTSDACVLYSPSHDLFSSGAVRIGPTTNNIAEYQVVIGLLTKAPSWDSHDLVVFMDS